MALGDYLLDQLVDDPDFQQKSYIDKVEILKGAGLEDAAAKQRALEAERKTPGGPSIMTKENLPTRLARGALGVAQAAAPSVVGGQVFRHAGRFIPGVRNFPAPMRESLGSMTGEAISQLLDKTKPFDVMQIGLAGAIGGASAQAGKVVPALSFQVGRQPFRWIFKHLPGSTEAFQQVGADELFDDIGRIAARTQEMAIEGMTTSDLWNAALRGSHVSIPAAHTRAAAQEIAAEIALGEEMGFVEKGWRNKIAKLYRRVDWDIEKPHGPVDPSLRQMDLTRRSLEDLMGVYREQPNVIGRQAKYILRGVFRDIDDAAARGIPEAVTLQQALAISRREKATESLLDYLDSKKALSIPAPGENTQFMKINRVLDDLRRVQSGGKPPRELALLDVGLEAKEIDDLIDTLEFWNQYTGARTPPRGTNVGSGPTLGAGAMGYALTGDPQMAAAMALGRWVFTRSLTHPQGRLAIRELIREGADVNIVDFGLQAMGQITRSMALNPSLSSIRETIQGARFENPQ